MAAESAKARPVVLLVDDETALRDSLREGLVSDFDVEAAASAEEAELMMATRAYDVVVSDHLMPGEEGLRFLERVSQRRPATRRIMLTGYMNPELISRSVAVAGLSACLVKPVHASELAKAIRAAMA
jgi:DNA-binding NarL/FixJ family response regulator